MTKDNNSQALVTFSELSAEEQQRNAEAVRDLVPGQWYEFDSPVQTIPMERRMRGARKFGQPITFTKAKYLKFNEDMQEHIFFVPYPSRPGGFFAPLFMCGGVTCRPIDPPHPPERQERRTQGKRHLHLV